MQQWEYQTTTLFPVLGFTKIKGWKLRAINEDDLPNWKETERYSTVTIFCNKMGQQGWELVSVFNVPNAGLVLYFKRIVLTEHFKETD